MPDFPKANAPSPISYCSLGMHTLLGEFQAFSGGANAASSAWTTANTAIYIPIICDEPFLAQKVGVSIGATSSGNIDVGIYKYDGTQVWHAGSTAMGTANTMQTFTVTAGTWLMPGTYFMAMNCDNTTGTTFSVNANVNGGRMSGLLIQAVGAIALPATATFAVYTARRVPYMILSGAATL